MKGRVVGWKRREGAGVSISLATLSVSLLLTAAGCGGTAPTVGGSELTGGRDGSVTTLSAEQTMLVEETVKTMAGAARAAGSADQARFTSLVALEDPASKTAHVCGYVEAPELGGQKRFYVELRKVDGGSWTAHRGQIGTDDAKLAKVRFVCREHDTGRPEFPEVVR